MPETRLLAAEVRNATGEGPAHPLPMVIGLRLLDAEASQSLTVVDMGHRPSETRWGLSTRTADVVLDGRAVGVLFWRQVPEEEGLACALRVESIDDAALPAMAIELAVPELDGVEHDWLLFRGDRVRTGVFSGGGVLRREDSDGDGERDALTIEPAERVMVRTNTDGYLVADRFSGITGVWHLRDERRDRPAFTARLAVREDPLAMDGIEVGFRLRHIEHREGLRAKDAAYASMYPERRLYASRGIASIDAVTLSADRLAAYERLTVRASCGGTWVNPFDPEDVRLDAIITTPSGKRLTVPGFMNRDYRFDEVEGHEVLEATGDPVWEVRFTPTEPGAYRLQLVLDDGSGRVASDPYGFEVTASEASGFVRVARDNPLYFEHDDGSLYFPIGMNVGWSGPRGQRDFEMYFGGIAEAEGNFARIWISPTFNRMGLERHERHEDAVPGANGLGWIDLKAAARVDAVLDLAERLDMKVMAAIESFSAMRASGEPRHWHESPYNAAQGGPLRRTHEVLSDPSARAYFRQRLRYIVARYGHHVSLMNWELWNEANGIDGYFKGPSADWHQEMARVIKDLDVYDHPVATSFWINHGDPEVDRLEVLDFVQTHIYGAKDFPPYFVPIAQRKIREYGRPHLFGEYGVNVSASGSTGVDLEGVHLHNGHWAALFSGSAGGPMVWWWDSYVQPNDLYHRMTPLARFVSGMPLNRVGFRPIDDIEIRLRDTPDRDGARRPLVIQAAAKSWDRGIVNQPNSFEVRADGAVTDFDLFPAVLHGNSGDNRHLHNPSTLRLNMPEEGRFIVHVETVSGWAGAGLEIEVNGEVLLSEVFEDNNGASRQAISTYNGAYGVDLLAGEHEVIVRNTGKDWLGASYEVTNFIARDDPGVDVWASRFERVVDDGLLACLWLRDEGYSWASRQQAEEELGPIQPCVVRLGDLPAGRYRVEWWDTFEGRVIATTDARGDDRGVVIEVPVFMKSMAAKVYLVDPAR
ncbi:DUF5060 domain-containing protein [Mucisphaera calidilacus]|uniref:DUF5060 domain-containing protein n=1 Tax=Mucisphaera calidilacus TaxID=2527982 RepID=A0A518BX83_9BACT|nr:DUF5060 domain-containing protein [Mucisphaera calidilacus]QDU71544.1 hypothetical protein Pan265_13940 [Mucisphaera calidilacus]